MEKLLDSHAEEVKLTDSTLVPVKMVYWAIGIIVSGLVLFVPWLSATYFKAQKVDDLESRLNSIEQRQAGSDERLRSIDENVKELREDVKKLLTSQPYSSNR